MISANQNIIDNYLLLFETLNLQTKKRLVELLTKSLKSEKPQKEDDFYNSFGAFSDEKSADEINQKMKKSRKFKEKDFKFS